jgi:hypothetical protein
VVKGRLGQEPQVSAAEAGDLTGYMSKDDTPQELVDQINAALRDLCDFNRLIWSALADQLDQRGILPKDDFARWMNSVADQMEEIRPHHRLGEQRLDTAMLRGIADIILDPKAELLVGSQSRCRAARRTSPRKNKRGGRRSRRLCDL